MTLLYIPEKLGIIQKEGFKLKQLFKSLERLNSNKTPLYQPSQNYFEAFQFRARATFNVLNIRTPGL